MIPVQNHYNIGVFSLLNLHTTQFIVVYIPFLFIDVYQHTARINLLIISALELSFFIFIKKFIIQSIIFTKILSFFVNIVGIDNVLVYFSIYNLCVVENENFNTKFISVKSSIYNTYLS